MNPTPLRLLFAIKSLNVAGGGAERVLTQISTGLSKRGHDVWVLTFDQPGWEPFYPLSDHVHRLGLGIAQPGKSTPRLALLRNFPNLRSVARRVDPDVVVAFMHSMYAPLGLSLIGRDFPLIASEHGVWGRHRRPGSDRLLLRITPWLSDVATATSHQARLTFPPKLRRHMTVIPNPVSSPNLAPESRRDHSHIEQRILSVGRFTHQKDHVTLLKAFGQIAPDFPNWTLRIVGDGPIRPVLEAVINHLGLEERVEMPGTVPNIETEYHQATIFAMPSRWESFGLGTAEALAHGLPVVGFASCPGTKALITDHVNGILVEGQDRIGAFTSGLRRLMSDVELRKQIKSNAPSSVEQFNIEPILNRWETLLYQCVNR